MQEVIGGSDPYVHPLSLTNPVKTWDNTPNQSTLLMLMVKYLYIDGCSNQLSMKLNRQMLLIILTPWLKIFKMIEIQNL